MEIYDIGISMDQISSAKINLLLNDIPLAVAKLQTVRFGKKKLKAGLEEIQLFSTVTSDLTNGVAPF